jgi:hypothetical protein
MKLVTEAHGLKSYNTAHILAHITSIAIKMNTKQYLTKEGTSPDWMQ